MYYTIWARKKENVGGNERQGPRDPGPVSVYLVYGRHEMIQYCELRQCGDATWFAICKRSASESAFSRDSTRGNRDKATLLGQGRQSITIYLIDKRVRDL